jgi:hypothetical protein
MTDIVSIILARGGSKGKSNKSIIDFCGKPSAKIQECRVLIGNIVCGLVEKSMFLPSN